VMAFGVIARKPISRMAFPRIPTHA
jgi:hypothetical protein